MTSLDEDRILRALLHLVLATLRTNWFQDADATGNPPPCVALKFDPSAIPDLPLPRPMFEIFVYSPRVEGVHLRAGKVARGGIRWSDRREDFRTEVLGLMKAQRVKNAVIVPAGAKGGFVVNRPPADAARLREEVEACYRLFIGALLDVTDNLVNGMVVPPNQVVRYDDDDPYLVVAADKGTAAFSDIANEIACGRGFWLGDAFASGGKHGYDHKAMGITARGAWESVRRHFRHLKIDPDNDDFTVVGIGDMSGDVFGNAMLLSEHIQLVAAFDHRHVFLDPDPDPAKSFAERRRLFELPRSSWADYDAAHISAGGGVYARTLKSIPITPAVRARLAIADGVDALTPAEVIRALLQAPVDLLYNGGIGTYVKARTETHAAVGDKANDAVRVDGHDLRCRSVAEGGNLGFTQDGRVEYALAGGRINTDAIDNSAGVDTSDHEVNIKIVLDGAVRDGELTEDRSQHAARQHDRRGRRARAARQLPPEPRPRQRARPGRDHGGRARAVHARARIGRAPRPRRRAAADRRATRRTTAQRPRPDRARARRADGVRQDRARRGAARIGSPRRPRLRARARARVPVGRARTVPRADPHPHAAPRDHGDRARQRSRQPGGHDVRVPHRRGDRRPRARHRARARGGAGDLRPGRCGATSRRSTTCGRRRRADRDVPREPAARGAGRALAAAEPAPTVAGRDDRPVLCSTGGAADGDGEPPPRDRGAGRTMRRQRRPTGPCETDRRARSSPARLDIAELADAHHVEVEVVAEVYNEVGTQLRFDWLGDRIVELRGPIVGTGSPATRCARMRPVSSAVSSMPC